MCVDLKYMRRRRGNTGADDLDTASRRGLPGNRKGWIVYDQRGGYCTVSSGTKTPGAGSVGLHRAREGSGSAGVEMVDFIEYTATPANAQCPATLSPGESRYAWRPQHQYSKAVQVCAGYLLPVSVVNAARPIFRYQSPYADARKTSRNLLAVLRAQAPKFVRVRNLSNNAHSSRPSVVGIEHGPHSCHLVPPVDPKLAEPLCT